MRTLLDASSTYLSRPSHAHRHHLAGITIQSTLASSTSLQASHSSPTLLALSSGDLAISTTASPAAPFLPDHHCRHPTSMGASPRASATLAAILLSLAVLGAAVPVPRQPQRPARIDSTNVKQALHGQARREFDALPEAAQRRAAMILDEHTITTADEGGLHFDKDGLVYFADPGAGIPGLNGTDVELGDEGDDGSDAARARRAISDQQAERIESNGGSKGRAARDGARVGYGKRKNDIVRLTRGSPTPPPPPKACPFTTPNLARPTSSTSTLTATPRATASPCGAPTPTPATIPVARHTALTASRRGRLASSGPASPRTLRRLTSMSPPRSPPSLARAPSTASSLTDST